MRYLQVTHIPFRRRKDGTVLIDRLWAEDLRGLAESMGKVTIAAPENTSTGTFESWGTGFAEIAPGDDLQFLSLPQRSRRFDPARNGQVRRLLREAVDKADLVHTSNLFEPDTILYAAHDHAVRTHKKTLFVVAEDFYDMLSWEWVRTAHTPLLRWRRERSLRRMDDQVRTRVANASLTFLHTPAAVERYRLEAHNSLAIRQPVHQLEDVISETMLHQRLLAADDRERPLHIVTASRLRPMKGLDFLIRAVAILRHRNIHVKATLYGEGSQRTELEWLIAHLNLEDRVTLPGPLDPAASLREALNSADIFAMPHLTNDFGRAFFDAMAAGLPVVAFQSIASQSTVRDGIDGLFCANADAEALASAVARLDSDRSLLRRCSLGARQRGLENTRLFWNNLRAARIHELFI